MPNFKFRLESVLDFRRRIEDTHKRELAQLRELLVKEQEFLRELEAKRLAMQERMRDSQAAGICNMYDIMTYYNYLTACREKIMQQISVIETLIEGIEKKREDLVAASKERKVMEKLREHHYQEFKKNMEHIETKVSDELATNGYTHRSTHERTTL